MGLSENTAAQKALDLAEAIQVVVDVVRMDNADRVLVAKYFIDDLIGTDETAVLTSLPFMTPELTETVSDLLVPILAEALIAKLTAPEPE
jgi:hypothetical protein